MTTSPTPSFAYLLAIVVVSVAVTLALRALPFLLFGSGRKPPRIVEMLGRILAPGAIAMLVAYCFCGHLDGGSIASHCYGYRELSAGAIVIALQLWRRNPLLSIITGTAVYMLLVNL